MTTIYKQDGSKAVITKVEDPDLKSKLNLVEIEEFDEDGNFVARTSKWRELSGGVEYTSVTYADGGNLTITRSPNGTVSGGFTTATGTHRAVPVDLIDQLSNTAGGAMSGLENLPGGGVLGGSDEAIEAITKSSKFGGPALSVATTAFDYMMADTPREKCLAVFGGIGGAGGGYGGGELGAWVGSFGGPYAPITVPLAVAVGATAGGLYGGDLGKAVGNVFCPP